LSEVREGHNFQQQIKPVSNAGYLTQKPSTKHLDHQTVTKGEGEEGPTRATSNSWLYLITLSEYYTHENIQSSKPWGFYAQHTLVPEYFQHEIKLNHHNYKYTHSNMECWVFSGQ
jgi:hypothetical protein